MPTAYVLNERLDAADKAAVDQLLSKCGFNPSYHLPADLSTIDRSSDVAIVCLPTDPSEVNEIDKQVKTLISLGIRVISIWLREDGVLSSGIEKFGSAAVGINSPDVENVLKGVPVWKEPSGKPREDQQTPRNKC